MAAQGIPPADTISPTIQTDKLAQDQQATNQSEGNREDSQIDEARNDKPDTSNEEQSETGLSEQQNRVERQDEIEFRNNDGDTATVSRQGREANQITANQPV
jgi:hypothetical protein